MENSYLYSFLTQMIQQKHGDDADAEFIQTEIERLEIDLKEKLLAYLEPMLDMSSKIEFEEMLKQEVDLDSVVDFMFGAIPDIQTKIIGYLDKYKTDYGNA